VVLPKVQPSVLYLLAEIVRPLHLKSNGCRKVPDPCSLKLGTSLDLSRGDLRGLRSLPVDVQADFDLFVSRNRDVPLR